MWILATVFRPHLLSHLTVSRANLSCHFSVQNSLPITSWIKPQFLGMTCKALRDLALPSLSLSSPFASPPEHPITQPAESPSAAHQPQSPPTLCFHKDQLTLCLGPSSSHPSLSRHPSHPYSEPLLHSSKAPAPADRYSVSTTVCWTQKTSMAAQLEFSSPSDSACVLLYVCKVVPCNWGLFPPPMFPEARTMPRTKALFNQYL